MGTTNIPEERFHRLIAFAAERGSPPRDFLTYRKAQLELILALSGIDVAGKQVVEVGGGVSGQAFLLAALAARVVSTDLLNVESVYGGDFGAAAAIRDIAGGNLSFVCGRAEELPLTSGSADIVFSSYVFEHVQDRTAAARETYRILRPGGLAVVLVPNLMETVLRTIWFVAVYWPRQVAKLLLTRTRISEALGVTIRYPPDLRHHTHGSYPGLRAELAGSQMGTWDSIFRAAGLEIVRRYTVNYEAYLGLFGDRLTHALQRRLLRLTKLVGATAIGAWLGPGYGFVVQRRP